MNYFKYKINSYLDKHARYRTGQFVEEFARKPDGTLDEPLATRVKWEVGRRAEMGKQLDIYEPLRWAGIQTALAFPVGVVIKYITDHRDKKFTLPALAVLAASTILNNAIQLVRIFPRYDAGLRGGAETAVKLQRDFSLPRNDQVSVYLQQKKDAEKAAPALPTQSEKQWSASITDSRNSNEQQTAR